MPRRGGIEPRQAGERPHRQPPTCSMPRSESAIPGVRSLSIRPPSWRAVRFLTGGDMGATGTSLGMGAKIFLWVAGILGAFTLVEFFFYGWAIDDLLKGRSEEHTSELQSRENLVCRLLLEKK